MLYDWRYCYKQNNKTHKNLKSHYFEIFYEFQDRFSENEVKRIQKIEEEVKIKNRELQELLDKPDSTESEKRQTIRQKKKVYYDNLIRELFFISDCFNSQ